MAKKLAMDLAAADGLDNEKRAQLLGVIDQLRELGISENVSLPQLVVVGDQSSGKSSVLEGLTGLSFPVASDLCTRFATQIVMQRVLAGNAGARITIIPGPTSRLDELLNQRLLGFERSLAAMDFGCQEFKDIFDEVSFMIEMRKRILRFGQAASCMGIPVSKTTDLEKFDKRFSNDILKIELSGPNHRHLSVVDVPGLFHNATKFQTEEDRAIIRKLIENFITDGRTIILAVMDARNNLANQELFSMARAADPAGKRTVGIITKCDALQEGDEAGVLRIAKNQVEKLTHGWFVVRNRSTKEINEGVTIEGRHQVEKDFFAQNHPWNKLQEDRVGIDALKCFLGHLLYDHIRSEFPAVIKDIENLSRQTEKDLELLGFSRQTATDQRRFLMRLINAYQSQVHNALGGRYDENLDTQSPLKLRMLVRKYNDYFALLMSRKGHAKIFRTVDGKIDSDFKRQEGEKENIYDWIRCYYVDSRGPELPGVVNPVVIENMFRQQSSPWESIGQTYINTIVKVVHDFNDHVLALIAPEDEVRTKLQALLLQQKQRTQHEALNKLQQILKDERGGVLQTVNHYYADTLSSTRRERVLARLESLGFVEGDPFDREKVMKSVHLSNDDQAVYDIHDMLKAYYKVAIKRFTDNVVIQITERHILGAEGPVKSLSPDLISDLSEVQLAELAGENFMTASIRNDLIAKAERFQEALKIARVVAV
ncbi:uncharacterized protein N7511_004311 [Penicillium nucicola]|uniref:uncharacterized protein n=1 Tax=Penicillium nucicola TaxID=1850975 RepID=UPI0025455C3D|nr:uncharacterized protein N7511_004311 [Penicillium nucicola]KAJ5766695.1 hypothetical protein N7511_004311 [Penicillium nucicola]